MSAFRPLLAPLTGAAVAGIVLYSMGTTLSTRTHQVSESLHFSSRSLRRLAEVDDTEDLLSRTHVAPDAATMASKWERMQEKGKEQLRAAYTTSSHPSLREEVKARWNEHLYSLTSLLSHTDLEDAISATSSVFSRLYSRLSGQPISTPLSGEQGTLSRYAGQAFHSAQRAVSSDSTAPATLRDPIPPTHDVRLDAPNTRYLGQGTSLR